MSQPVPSDCVFRNVVTWPVREKCAEKWGAVQKVIGRKDRRPACHCTTEFPEKPFGASTHLAQESAVQRRIYAAFWKNCR
jgi:hypothetical protein